MVRLLPSVVMWRDNIWDNSMWVGWVYLNNHKYEYKVLKNWWLDSKDCI